MVRILLTFILLFSGISNASAQQQTAAAPAPNAYATVPNEYLQEAEQFHQYCEANTTMNRYYNCECMAVKFLDRRIAAGPELSQDSIILNLQDTCQDAANAAGEAYQRCMSNPGTVPQNASPESFCACLGNTYGKLFEKSGLAPNSRNFVALKTKAQIACQNPGQARRIYNDVTSK